MVAKRSVRAARNVAGHVKRDLLHYAMARKRVHICVTLIIGCAELAAVFLTHELMIHATLTTSVLAWEVAIKAVE